MIARYFELSTEELEAERDKQADAVSNATPDSWIEEWHKLAVLKNMIAWRAVEAARFGDRKKSASKPKISPRQQAGVFEFGKKSKVSGERSKGPLSSLTARKKE